jgi:hypothetical protein
MTDPNAQPPKLRWAPSGELNVAARQATGVVATESTEQVTSGHCSPGELHLRIQGILHETRRRLNRYIWIEGIGFLLIWLVVSFWIFLVVDRGLVIAGLSELPWTPRAVILTIIIGGSAFVVFRWLVRRLLVRIPDESIALLIERKFSQLNDGLATEVQFSRQALAQSPLTLSMLDQSRAALQEQLAEIDLRLLFNPRPMRLAMILSMISVLSIFGLAVFSPQTLQVGTQRLYLLASAPWPRAVRLQVLGVRVHREAVLKTSALVPDVVAFENQRIYVSRGSKLGLLVEASGAELESPSSTDESAATRGSRMVNRAVRGMPEKCTLYYSLQNGKSGRAEMSRDGSGESRILEFDYDKAPFESALQSFSFYVRSGDARAGLYHVEVVDEPMIIRTSIDCVFPDYLVEKQSQSWTPRTIDLTAGTKLPRGTQITLNFFSNKPLRTAMVRRAGEKESELIDMSESVDRQGFRIEGLKIDSDLSLELMLLDEQKVTSSAPQKFLIRSVEDKVPTIDAYLAGIGGMITRNALLPLRGTAKDDYALSTVELAIETNSAAPFIMPLKYSSSGEIEQNIDLSELQTRSESPIQLPSSLDAQLTLQVRVHDRYDLNGETHVGASKPIPLDLVTSEQLTRHLEQLEIGQRRALEQILQEVLDVSQYLNRSKVNRLDPANETSRFNMIPDETGGLSVRRASLKHEPGTASTFANPVTQDSPAESGGMDSRPNQEEELQQGEMRMLFAQRAVIQIRKSAQDVLDVAESIKDLRSQIINNRLPLEDKAKRLQSNVIEPLDQIAKQTMKQLELESIQLEKQLRQSIGTLSTPEQEAEILVVCDRSLMLTETTIRELDQVLRDLLRYESYSELLEVVRQLIKEQESLRDETQRERKRRAVDDLIK